MAVVSRTLTTRSSLAAKLEGAAEKKVGATVREIATDAEARANATIARDYQERTGASKGSITAQVSGNEFPVKITMSSSVDHVNILNAGAKPHVITPKNAKFLQFQATLTGLPQRSAPKAFQPRGQAKRFQSGRPDLGINKIVRTDRVNHPGIKPGRFMERALEAAFRNAIGRSPDL
jgi:hypothetical protein